MERNDDIDVDNRQINSKLNWLAISFCLLATSDCGSATPHRSHRIHFHSRSLHKRMSFQTKSKNRRKEEKAANRLCDAHHLVPAQNLHTHSTSTVRWASYSYTMTMTCITVRHYGIARTMANPNKSIYEICKFVTHPKHTRLSTCYAMDGRTTAGSTANAWSVNLATERGKHK